MGILSFYLIDDPMSDESSSKGKERESLLMTSADISHNK
jgi:hypothetical protein